MLASKLQIQLPRRITAYFLLFGLAALVWLSIGALYVARSISDNHSESASLRRLGRACDRVTLAYLRDKNTDLQSMLAEIRAQSGASYCAIVSPTGAYLAHSSSGYNGNSVAEQGGMTERWGEVMRVKYIDENGETMHEYRAPLLAGDAALGTFRLGVAQPNLWTYARAGGQYAPLAIIGPACCMVAGAVLLNRMVRPVADIEQQLYQVATSPSVEGCELREVPSVGAAALGWNRVVQQRIGMPKSETLRERVRQSLAMGHNGRLDSVLNSIPEGVATTDAEGRITYMNLPMAVIIGLMDVAEAKGENGPDAESPRMTEQLVKQWHLAETDELLAEENRGRPLIAEVSHD
jgi:PAS domain-containing protein